MQIAFFGSSLVSSYWNGAATYYRGIVRSLHERGHKITFYEPDAWQRQQNRDIPDPPWAQVVVYPATEESVLRTVEAADGANLIVKASGVGVFDELLEQALLELKRPSNLVVFWDVDAPATLDRLLRNSADPFSPLIPRYDAVFTYGGGDPVVHGYEALGARRCVPIYNAVDPDTHFPVASDSRFSGGLAFLGNRLPDREARVEEFFLRPATQLADIRFLLGGSGWGDKPLNQNIRYFDHISTRDHNAFNSGPLAVLNVTRDSMARNGFSPATRVFEAAGAAACLITDAWPGIDMFFEPGREILVAANGGEVVEHLRSLTPASAKKIGAAAYRRVLAEHTYAHRAAQIDALLEISAFEDLRVAV
ncbi:MAG TPA: glycosyltransferase [Bryobacteraceae bacterium]|jgi:spore maturation protein CgeB